MSLALAAPPQTAVRFRHRRRPPALHFGIIGGGFIAITAFAASSHWVQAGVVLLAAVVLGLGWLGRERLWIEDQLLTDSSAVIVHADGALFELAYADMVRAAERRNAIAFVRADGAELRFNRNPHVKRVKRILAEVAPEIDWVDEVDLACDT